MRMMPHVYWMIVRVRIRRPISPLYSKIDNSSRRARASIERAHFKSNCICTTASGSRTCEISSGYIYTSTQTYSSFVVGPKCDQQTCDRSIHIEIWTKVLHPSSTTVASKCMASTQVEKYLAVASRNGTETASQTLLI